MTIEINDKSAGNGLDGEFMVDSTKWDRFSHFLKCTQPTSLLEIDHSGATH